MELVSDVDEEEEIEIDELETNRERSGILGKRVSTESLNAIEIVTNESIKRHKK